MKLDKSRLAVVSVTTRNYGYRAKALFESVAHLVPEAQRRVYSVDNVDSQLLRNSSSFALIEASNLGIKRFKQLAAALEPTAICCLLKPHAIMNAFRDPKVDLVVYLDNDVVLYREPTELLENLKISSCTLTPHHLAPLPQSVQLNEQFLHTYGIFNAGIIGFRRCEETLAFLEWWAGWMLDPRRLVQHFGYDQVWLNYVPVYCPNFSVLRDPSYNVAYWNLPERNLHSCGDQFHCGSKVLTAFHYSNFRECEDGTLVPPAIPLGQSEALAITKMSQLLTNQWKSCDRDELSKLGYAFAKWPDGKRITNAQRDLIKISWDSIPCDLDPWEERGSSQNLNIFEQIRNTDAPQPSWLKRQTLTASNAILDMSLRRAIKGIHGLIRKSKAPHGSIGNNLN